MSHFLIRIFLVWFLLYIYLGKGQDWAKDIRADEFELICPHSPDRTFKYTEYEACHLARVPAHAVVTREDVRSDVVAVLKSAQVSSLQFCVDFPVAFIFLLSLHFLFCDVDTSTGGRFQ